MKIPLGLAGFRAVHAPLALLSTVRGVRLYRIPATGPMAWDPIEGRVEYSGRTFRAEQIGELDGKSWLWSWASTELEIPEDKTTIARRMRASASKCGVPALPNRAWTTASSPMTHQA